MKDTKNFMFYVYLIIQGILWVLVSLTRQIPSTDAMEAIAWSDLISLGTNKHPPLSGWLMGIFYNIFGHHDVAVYILGEFCIILGLIYVYKLAKYFLSEDKAKCATIIMCICFYYTYHTFINNYNCNIISMCLWPIIVYYFYKSAKNNRLKDWIILGITAGLGFLAKYQVVFLYFPLFLYLLVCERKQFKNKNLYISAIIAAITILPHIIWLYKTDFFSLIYIMTRTDVSTGNTPKFLLPLGRLVFPIKFYLNQISAIIPCIVLYLLTALKEKNITVNKGIEPKSEKIFLLMAGLLPIILLGGTGAINNSRVIGAWGSTMLSFIGVLLFYFFPIKFGEYTFKYFYKCLIGITLLWLSGIYIFSTLQTQTVISYPKKSIMNDFDNIWAKETNNSKLKYVGGHIDYIFQFRLYNKEHPTIILETFGHDNPWLNQEDIIESGAIIVDKKSESLIKNAKDLIKLLPDNFEIKNQKYEFKICNKINKCTNETFYYTIVPPRKIYDKISIKKK